MQKRIKVAIATVTITAVLATGTALAVAHPALTHGGSPHVSVPSTSTTAVVEQIPPEAVVTTSTTAKPEASSPEVQANQQKLMSLGYWLGVADGRAGVSTQQAVYAFQKVNHLPRTGSLDAGTIAALANAQRPQPASSAGDLIEIDKARQVIFVVRDGKTQWVFNTSTGTERSYVTNGIKGFAHTPTGTFRVNRQVDGVDPGDLGPLYRPRYFTNNGIAVHGAASIPAQPASHGCARVSNAVMDFIWANNLMPMQSLVWVYDDPKSQPIAPPNATATSTSITTSTTSSTTTTTSTSTTSSTTSSTTTTMQEH